MTFYRDSPTLEGQVPVFISPGAGWPSYAPDTGFPFRRLLRLAGLRWRRWRSVQNVKVKVNVTLPLTVSQSVCLGVEPHCFLFESSCPHHVGVLSDGRTGLSFVRVIICSMKTLSVCTIIYILPIINNSYIQYIQSFCQSRLSTADYALY
jgi:hypothetical protein